MRKCFVPLALAIAALYLTLSVSAMACLFAHESQPGSAHHTGGVTHSSLCVWACHANPTAAVPPAIPSAQLLYVVAMGVAVNVERPARSVSDGFSSRGPPLH
ncbi:MAG: hypothetical protein NT179_06525 [Nitrospirae bacterium]|nr:hypothetical protein [Nitrospirota bacterium]